MILIIGYKVGNKECARKCYLSIEDSYPSRERENRARHGLDKVYRNSLYINVYKNGKGLKK